MSAQPRSDRKPYDVVPRRGYWVGWYYTTEGDRVTNVTLYDPDVAGPRLVKFPVTEKDPLRCPNRHRAYEQIKRIAEMPATARIAVPTLAEAIDQWERHLVNQGCEARSANRRAQLIRTTISGLSQPGQNRRRGERKVVIPGTNWSRVTQINRQELEMFIERMADGGRAISTRNVYVTNWGTFARWLLHKCFLMGKPLDGVLKGKQKADRRPRRPFTRQEFELLVSESPREHRDYYLCLGLSGLRREESLRLRKEDAHPLFDRPYWRLPAKIQKVKQPQRLPMMPRLASAIGQRWLLTPAGGVLFPAAPSKTDFRRLLAKCGIQRVNAEGEALSWHSFRQYFATQVAKVLGMRFVQQLMRHSSIKMTMDLYRKLHIEDVDDVWGCPDI